MSSLTVSLGVYRHCIHLAGGRARHGVTGCGERPVVVDRYGSSRGARNKHILMSFVDRDFTVMLLITAR